LNTPNDTRELNSRSKPLINRAIPITIPLKPTNSFSRIKAIKRTVYAINLPAEKRNASERPEKNEGLLTVPVYGNRTGTQEARQNVLALKPITKADDTSSSMLFK
jgi:hypothetical protein